jgi:uncharacterized membrane protein (DUF485 family)
MTGRTFAARGPTPQPPANAGSAYATIVQDPMFQQLVGERTRFAWTLTILMLVVYFGFIGLIVARANTRFDALSDALKRSVAR